MDLKVDYPDVKLYLGDSLEVLKTLPEKSVNCCVTSPPYFGLRDYGVNGQIGLEGSPEEYTDRLVGVFREVWRVLRDDGTLWLNLGDSYANKPMGSIKPKDLIGIPWRVAFALQADGWYLRQDIIWHKPNPMPESIKDRCTKSHEYIFLLSKSSRYHYDNDAIKEPSTDPESYKPHRRRNEDKRSADKLFTTKVGNNAQGKFYPTKNKRSVWTVIPKPYKDAHFAVFPPKLIEPCVLAGCPPGGVVLDPFSGSGTTGAVSLENGRKFVGVELNPDYIALSKNRLSNVQPKLPL